MFTVTVRDLEFYGYHGVPAAEREIGHRYVLTLHAEVDGVADLTDLVVDTVDYAALAAAALEVSQAEPCHTLERLARRIGDTILERFLPVRRIEVSLRKRLPPAPVIVQEMGVTLRLDRI